MCPEELSLAALGQTLSSTPAPGKQLHRALPWGSRSTTCRRCPLLHERAPGAAQERCQHVAAKAQGGRAAQVCSPRHGERWALMSFQATGKIWTHKPVRRKEKLLGKASPIEVNLEIAGISQEIQLWRLPRAVTYVLFVNNSAPRCTTLRKNQDSSNLSGLLQQKADGQFCVCSYSTQAIKQTWFGFTTFPDLPFRSTSCPVLPSCTLDKFCFRQGTETRPGFVLNNFFIQKFRLCNSCCLHTTTIKRHQQRNLTPCPWGSLKWPA